MYKNWTTLFCKRLFKCGIWYFRIAEEFQTMFGSTDTCFKSVLMDDDNTTSFFNKKIPPST